LNGAVTLGDATGDDITITGYVASNIVPKTDNGYNLGSSTKEWKHGYFDGTVFADNLDGDSGTIGNLNFNASTISNGSGDINLDADGDIALDVDGDDIYFKQAGTTRVTWNLGANNQEVDVTGNLIVDAEGDIDLDADGGNVRIKDNAVTQFNFIGGTNKQIDIPTGTLTVDVGGKILLDADSGEVNLVNNGTQYGGLVDSANDLVIVSGSTTALTFNGANVTTGGTITPGTTLNTVGTDLVTAINEVHDDVGTISSLSTFYNSHNADVVTALNRVAARIIDVYDENGTLLNN